MSLPEMEKFVFTSKYAGYLENKKRRESWQESTNRLSDMFLQKYPDCKDLIEEVRIGTRKKIILGSQRALQFAGKPMFKHNARGFNCCGTQCDRGRFFQECMYLLLCGCGTGFSVQKHHIKKLPKLIKKKEGQTKFVIPDSIEGWADAIGILVNSYFRNGEWGEYEGTTVTFDYRAIRERGANLSSSAGKAPGPEPLKKAINKIRRLLDACIENGQTQLRPIDAYDIVMHSADAVISGGVRRSACIALFSPTDKEMLTAKTGNWIHENPQRGRSNNSVVLLKDKTEYKSFAAIVEKVKEFGEPGFAWVDNLEICFNPCMEISFYCYDKEGNSGWQVCNLSTINGKKVKTKEDFYKACRLAAIIGTFQAGFDEFPYLGSISENIIRREALLGVSMTGMMESPDICLDPEIQRAGAEIIKKTNAEIAKLIGINQASRTTCVKPEGTSSCVLGTSSGIHPHHAKRYIRRIQTTKDDVVYQYFKNHNPLACEESVWSNNNTDDVISFCIEVPDGAKLKNQMSAIDLLSTVKSTQQNWVGSGTNKKLCTQPWLRHNVSNTIHIKEHEWDDVVNYIYKNKKHFCGVALLSFSGDKDYCQAPFTMIHLPSETVSEYGDGALFVSGLIVKACELYDDDLWLACDILLGFGEPAKGKSKKEWVKSCKKFSEKYMENNIKRLTYCMKDVYNWKLWLDLNREYKTVDYEKLTEETNNVQYEGDSACSGGKCELI